MSKRCQLGFASAHSLVASRLHTVRCLVPKVRTQDPDGIHDMRVASRRLRAALSEYEDAFPRAELKKIQKRARRITQGLGCARELDVTLQRLNELRAECPPSDLVPLDHVILTLQAEREKEDSPVARCVELAESSAFAHTADLLLSSAVAQKSCYVDSVRSNLRKRMRGVRAKYREWLDSHKDEELHAVRIAFKKLRYACEAHAAVYRATFDEFVDSLKKVQTALGDWNDFRIVRNHARRILDASADATSAPHEGLFHTLDEIVHKHQSHFAALAEDFFSKASRERFSAMLHAPDSPCCGGAHPKGEDPT